MNTKQILMITLNFSLKNIKHKNYIRNVVELFIQMVILMTVFCKCYPINNIDTEIFQKLENLSETIFE